VGKLLLFGLLLALPARAAEHEWSFSGGAGLAYELVGVNLAYRSGQVEGYLGVGVMTVLEGASGGARFFARPDGSGFFVGLNLGAHMTFFRDQETTSRIYSATITPGWRFVLGERAFAQLAAGGGLAYSFRTFRTPPSPERSVLPTPDLLAGVGFRF